ncbi:TetR family transcriptional regulator [Pseudomonas syringae]|uniref:TetR family transcriptional regulator n=1 Tax=Pseudomonas syringae TaxID=317 RepID=A0A1C7ZA25_PSESX|nr:TetR/AcrR family transcriptional regulator [Pseudomonas syringae]OCR26040.1 TetR family transcriptional regulator [Pseudomonas syringae]
MRADAQKNYDHILTVARDVFTEQGVDASIRDVARRAEVGLGTLYRHFPTREALFEALLRTSFNALTIRAGELETVEPADDALVSWLGEIVAVARSLRGVIAVMVAAIEEPESALHASCVTMKASGTRLLGRAQGAGLARADIDGADLFALVGALTWINDQPSLAARANHLFDVISSSILLSRGRAID